MLLEQLDMHIPNNNNNNNNLDTDLTPFSQINPKYIIDLNVNCKTTEVLEDNIDKNLDNFEYGDAFIDTTPKI